MSNVNIAIAVFLAFVVKKKKAFGNTRLSFMHFISIRALLVTFVQMRVPGIPPNPRRSTFELKLKAGERSLFWLTLKIIIL